ncbi:hypothetical protein CH379_014170 [Leptospira ellisii]|uniref:Uncharacterized protein n=1 Tax=Leptospira ellisii TaxID=2023197 RepID=A0A2N0B806_9LEPT|nr:hypothetical protein [Leptospira ellisii]MDV6236770.1 hypothetical protein [Leptospira ellisii]PJZ92618.1 hypothetical protein CH379_12225 [Leptospira ellisii]PKA03646.1 hypothetical protein CH375_15765 [Leptospira ellisii]
MNSPAERPLYFYVFFLVYSTILFAIPTRHVFAEKNPPDKKIEILIPEGSDSDWGKNALPFEDLNLLGDVDENVSQTLFEKSKEDFLKSVDLFRKASDLAEEKRKEFERLTFEADRYEWQRKNRKENFERSVLRDLNKARSDSVHHLVAAMNSLEKIQNPKVKDSESYRELQAGIYREYVKHQLALRNFLLAMDLLERYINLGNKYYEDSEAQGLLANCYERAYRLSKKNRDDEAREKYDILRKKHGLLYAEFKFGKNSPDYKEFSRELFKD